LRSGGFDPPPGTITSTTCGIISCGAKLRLGSGDTLHLTLCA
jgi:hypothetical protein